jgi:hypothetical protein
MLTAKTFPVSNAEVKSRRARVNVAVILDIVRPSACLSPWVTCNTFFRGVRKIAESDY